MTPLKYVISGHRGEYREYIRQHPEISHCYVWSIDDLAGLVNPDGVFIGSWREREDIEEVLVYLLSRMTNLEKATKIKRLIKDIQKKKYS